MCEPRLIGNTNSIDRMAFGQIELAPEWFARRAAQNTAQTVGVDRM